MSAPGDGQDVSLLAFSFYDATPEARAATLERLRAAWEANTVLALGELVHVAALRADPTVASSWASGSLDEALEGLVERPYSMEPVVLRGTAEATIAELEARLKAAEMERDAAQARAEAIMEESVRATSEISAGATRARAEAEKLQAALDAERAEARAIINGRDALLEETRRQRDEALQRLADALAPVGDVDVEEVLRLDREGTPAERWTADIMEIREGDRYVRSLGLNSYTEITEEYDFDDPARAAEHEAALASIKTDEALFTLCRTAAPALAREVIRLRELVRFVDEQGAEAIDRVSREIVADKWRATGEFQRRALTAEDKLTRLQVVVLEHAASLAKHEHLPSDDRADWVECYGPELTWEVVRAEIERTQRALTAAARRLAEAAGSR